MKKGFNLIELMVTVAIIAILASVSYAMYGPWVAKGRMAHASACMADITPKLTNYKTLYGKYPEDATWWADIGLTVAPCDNPYYSATYIKSDEYGYWLTISDTKFPIYTGSSEHDVWITRPGLTKAAHTGSRELYPNDTEPTGYP